MSSSTIYGWHSVIAALKQDNIAPVTLYISSTRQQDKKIHEVLEIAARLHLKPIELSRLELDKKYPSVNHQGIVLICSTIRDYSEDDLEQILAKQTKKKIILILDGVTDPHNLGACLRTADAAGAIAVLAPKDRNVGLTPTVRKVACGAAENVPFIQVTNLARTIKQLQNLGIWIYGAAGDEGKSIYDVVFPDTVALILGAEDKGLRRLTRELCDELIAIPMLGSVDSLNVSVATGVCLFEVVRQQLK